MSTVQCVARVHTGSDDILYRRQSNATARETRLGANASDYRKAVFFIKQLLKRGNHLVVHQVADSRFTVVHSLALVDPIAVDIDWLREI
eukprot:1196289-Prorocentrum_minimum.AAC.8